VLNSQRIIQIEMKSKPKKLTSNKIQIKMFDSYKHDYAAV